MFKYTRFTKGVSISNIGSASSQQFAVELVNGRDPKMRIIFVLKLLSTVALFVVFFAIFGLSSIQKYMQKDIVTVSRTEPKNGCLPLPAVLVCPEREYGGAWKEDCKQPGYNLTGMDVCSRNHA